MTAIHETAYPRLKSQPSTEDLLTVYTPTKEEIELVRSQSRQTTARLALMLLLKSFQRLGYFVSVAEMPGPIIDQYRSQLSDHWLFEEQFARWKRGNVSAAEKAEVD